jgi:glycosyltransferase involved in cell wall biosynthesis
VYSLVIPVFRNEGSIPELLGVLADLNEKLGGGLEAVIVVDGSPDRCAEILEAELPRHAFRSKLVLLSRNFGAFAAVRTGLAEAGGPWFAVMAADLQEPPELILAFFRALEKEPVDVVIGTRATRDDPAFSRWSSRLFWWLYRRLVQPEMPPGGVDVFGCNQAFRDHLLALHESNSTLVGLLFWLGFRRKLLPYERRARRHGRSAWTLARRLRYLSDSVFAFSDLPVRLLVGVGGVGLVFSVAFAIVVLVARLSGWIPVPGYAGTALLITFFAALNSFGLGVIGSYVWRAFENTKGRPQSIVRWRAEFGGDGRR